MIVVLGMAGSGKSTLCKVLNDTGKFRWISASGLLTKHSTPEIEAYRAVGKMVPESVIVPLIVEDLKKYNGESEALLDGFPRTKDQAADIVNYPELKPRLVVHLMVDENEALNRLQLRQRADDTEEAIRQRFSDYNDSIEDIMEIFKSMGTEIADIDANVPVADVHAAAKKVLGVI